MAAGPRRSATWRCCPSYRWQSNIVRGRIDFTTCHPQLLGNYRCAQEHLSFYALTILFPFISRCKRSHTRAAKKDGDSNDEPIFSQTHFHSVKLTTPLSGSFSSHNDGYYKDLCTFAASVLVHHQHGDHMTDIDQSVLACSHTLND